MKKDKLSIGLFGFGVVGGGLYQVLQETPSLNATIRKVCIKHPNKKRSAPDELFTTDANELLYDDSINVIVEVIDNADEAFAIVSTALKQGKAVVSASKKMIAEHMEELLQLQQDQKVPFLYEAACCASIPLIRNLEEYYDNDLLQGISGIVNGSTNFILTRIFEDGLSYHDALKQAQELGFAESNPALDVEGVDALNKLTIFLTHAYGIVTAPSEIAYTGIQNIHVHDAVVASEKGNHIKLVAQAKKLQDNKVAAFVLPQFVSPSSQLYNVRNEYNGMIIGSRLADEQFFYGKGAGSYPTASAVLSDIAALRYRYRYEYKKLHSQARFELATDFYLRVYASFEAGGEIPTNKFERIEEWHSDAKRCYLTGILHFSKLRESDWWKQPGASLILHADGILESLPETASLKVPEAAFQL